MPDTNDPSRTWALLAKPETQDGVDFLRPTRQDDSTMQQTVSEQLRARSRGVWDAAVEHRLFLEIASDTVSDAVFRRYLRIEFGFIDTAAIVMGYAIAKAPSLEVRRHLSVGLYGLTTDQCAFFAGCLGADASRFLHRRESCRRLFRRS